MGSDDFQQQAYRVMEDSDLTTLEKFVMVAHYLYEGNPSLSRIARGTGLHPQLVQHLQNELMKKDWLASPEG